VPRVSYSARALADLERLFKLLADLDSLAASDAIPLIVEAVAVVERHPLIGRPVRGRIRELVISHGRNGYVALYRVTPRRDRVEVLALRHQREAGYAS
jgi:plasmid stabilization system protein ParE